jgi:hypothetical protein
MEAPGAVIAARLRDWAALDLPVERDVFGTVVPEELAATVDDWCGAHLGARIDRYVFFDSSSGSVHGVVLTDGRAVAVKGHRSTVTRGYITAVSGVQAALAASGYPAPRPLTGPVSVGGGHVTAEVMVERSGGVDGHDPGVRAALAGGLAKFVVLGRPHRDRLARVAHPLHVPDGELYPTPHSPRFDFAATAPGAEWIDGLRARAMRRLRSGSELPNEVVHGDWRIENLSVRAGRLVGVYDWDSVHVATEVSAVATAATTFSVDWTARTGRRFPRGREIDAFVSEYEAARGEIFTTEESDILAAAMVASLAYGARCEHGDIGQPPAGDDSQRGLLTALGEALLDDGLGALRA